MAKHLAAGTPYMFSDVGISAISPLAQSFKMKTSGKCAHTRREEVTFSSSSLSCGPFNLRAKTTQQVRSVRGDDSQVSVPAQKKLLVFRAVGCPMAITDPPADTGNRFKIPVRG